MRYAEIDSKGKFTGVVYEELNDRIIADRAQYGNTLVAVQRSITDPNANSKDASISPDYGEPTAEELARPVQTTAATLSDLSAAVAALSARVKALEDATKAETRE